MVLAAQLARALTVKPDNGCNRRRPECAIGHFHEEDDEGHAQSKTEHHENAERGLNCGEAAVKEVADDDAQEVSDDLSEEANARLARLQNYACPKLRRKALLGWVGQRVQEISREDADEPDSEDNEIRSRLMDAVGNGSVNIEADLCDVSLDFCKPIQVHNALAGTSSGSRIRFADSSLTYLLKCDDTDDGIDSLLSGLGPRWTFDRVVETSVFDSPSAPLRKMSSKKEWLEW